MCNILFDDPNVQRNEALQTDRSRSRHVPTSALRTTGINLSNVNANIIEEEKNNSPHRYSPMSSTKAKECPDSFADGDLQLLDLFENGLEFHLGLSKLPLSLQKSLLSPSLSSIRALARLQLVS
jgi:hypothetical protein